ncbi:MAG: hydroxymethylglutaryl-CoA lyase [Spirochaetaceae bacterium]|nr:MAG: hydroxymethylglutaryl-CoA lyase [Spirochaetaceae bacterium]
MKSVEILEVGPRDGFQNVAEYIPIETKVQIIEGLLSAGMRQIQITSFVSPRAVPQMKDARELAEHCVRNFPGVDFFALVPNLRGAETALESGIRRLSYVVSLSGSHNRANTSRTHEESFGELVHILKDYPQVEVCLDLATTFGCPFEGKKSEEDVVPFLKPYVDTGIGEVNLCDTIGIANPAQVRRTIAAVRNAYPSVELQIHIHDTRNMGMVNTLAAIEQGVNRVQSTLGGLGGCPFAPGASGNLATEDLAFMLTEMGYELRLDIRKLIELARFQSEKIPGGRYSGHLFTIEDGPETE